MAQKVRDIMTAKPSTVQADDTLVDAARLMKEHDIGPVLVLKDDGKLCGVVTDRDITVRAVAEGKDPSSTRVDDVCSHDVTSVSPDTDVDEAIELMRKKAVRRLPVMQDGKPVGIVALGDLAIERDSRSALADISAAEPNE